MAWILIILLGLSSDQLLKRLVSETVGPADRIPVIDGFFHIIHRTNPGAAWSFLANVPWGIHVLAATSAVASLLLAWMIFRYPDPRLRACLSFILAGSLGNLVDRVLRGGVVDYLDFHFGSYIFPTFNLADMMIVCGAIALGALVLFRHDFLESALQSRPGSPGGGEGKAPG